LNGTARLHELARGFTDGGKEFAKYIAHYGAVVAVEVALSGQWADEAIEFSIEGVGWLARVLGREPKLIVKIGETVEKLTYEEALALGKRLGVKSDRLDDIAHAAEQYYRNAPKGVHIILKDGFYEVAGMKITKQYYEKLWTSGRGAPFVVAREILENGTKIGPDAVKPGFFVYRLNDWKMVFNPKTGEIWHLQPKNF